MLMPALFIGHGNPMNAIVENEFTLGIKDISKILPKPKAILCISAHWYTNSLEITAMEHPKTIHDFYGFPQELYAIEYPALGNPKLAKEIQELLHPIFINSNYSWGFDHGTWTVTKHLYPNADIPIIQLSIDSSKPPLFHFELGKKLAQLREQEILIIGSGNIIHNLRLVDFNNINTLDYGFDWAIKANEIIHNQLAQGDYLPLINYKSLGSAIQKAIPTPEHFLPLLYILGTQNTTEKITLFNDNLIGGSLSMTSITIS